MRNWLIFIGSPTWALYFYVGGEGVLPLRYNDKGPCLGCDLRHMDCHSDCQRYLDWRKGYDKELETIRKNKVEMIAHAQYVRERYRKEQ